MKLKAITFGLENCDSITIDGKYVGEFNCEDIRRSISRVACNAINIIDTCYDFVIEISKSANKERYQFDQTDYEDFKQMTFDRLTKFSDIASITLEFIDQIYSDNDDDLRTEKELEPITYYISWTGDSDYTNDSQKYYISDLGNLYIVINHKKCIFDVFNIETVNDREYKDFSFNMMDIE